MPVPARRPRLLLAICVVLVLAVPAGAAAATRLDGVERQVVRSLNEVRAGYGLASLRIGRSIAHVAAAHSATMARTGVLSHGAWLGRVARAARTPRVGEVLAFLSRTPPRQQARLAVRWWLASPPHRAVILSPSFHRLGVGRAGHGVVVFLTVDVAR